MRLITVLIIIVCTLASKVNPSNPVNKHYSEAVEYFKNAKTLECLSRYPKIKQLFLKYNVTIPLSAPVERLFSVASLVLNSRCNIITNGKFKKLLLMRYIGLSHSCF